jgi:hypothetical protein
MISPLLKGTPRAVPDTTENALHNQLFIPSQVLSTALLTFFSTELKFDKSTPYGPYLISSDPQYNWVVTVSDMSDP